MLLQQGEHLAVLLTRQLLLLLLLLLAVLLVLNRECPRVLLLLLMAVPPAPTPLPQLLRHRPRLVVCPWQLLLQRQEHKMSGRTPPSSHCPVGST